MRRLMVTILAVLAMATVTARGAHAAAIVITDLDESTITLTVNDFEGGFLLDGVLFQQGLSIPQTITLTDGGHTISGTWLNPAGGSGNVDILFALAGAPTLVTSGIAFGWSTSGNLATLNGSFGGFVGSPYFGTVLPTSVQLGQTVGGAAPFLSVAFTSEAATAVPEPASVALVALGLAGFGVRRLWQRKA